MSKPTLLRVVLDTNVLERPPVAAGGEFRARQLHSVTGIPNLPFGGALYGMAGSFNAFGKSAAWAHGGRRPGFCALPCKPVPFAGNPFPVAPVLTRCR